MTIRRDRIPGGPLDPVLDVSEEFGEGAIILSDGVPDCVFVPDEFGDGSLVEGIRAGDRCDVNGVFRPPSWSPVCLKCGTKDDYVRMWEVIHLGTSLEFLLFECACKSINWAVSSSPEKREREERITRFMEGKALEPTRLASFREDRNWVVDLLDTWSKRFDKITDLDAGLVEHLRKGGWQIVDAVQSTEDDGKESV